MPKKILSVGIALATTDIESSDFFSKTSLLDWDIIIFRPDIANFVRSGYGTTDYKGKPCLSDDRSFRLREACSHWRREIKEATESGKTIIAFMNNPLEIFVATGSTETSGTGRNQKVTRLVEIFSSYHSLPNIPEWTQTEGNAMQLNNTYSSALGGYWNCFASRSSYNVIFKTEAKHACILTKVGQRAVSYVIRHEKSGGCLLLLPDLDFHSEDFYSQEGSEVVFTSAASQFAQEFTGELVVLDRALKLGLEKSPEPDWASEPEFTLEPETSLRSELLLAEAALEQAQQKKEELVSAIEEAGQLRGLLFEKGTGLEAAIIKALKILGFEAAPYRDSESEFDVIFVSDDLRLIGEAEGKDNKAINVEKFRQLALNISEDLLRHETIVPAKGILFGNGYRLTALSERPSQFTDKCISSAESLRIGLVPTSELFMAAKYVLESGDHAFAVKVREALASGVGILSLNRR